MQNYIVLFYYYVFLSLEYIYWTELERVIEKRQTDIMRDRNELNCIRDSNNRQNRQKGREKDTREREKGSLKVKRDIFYLSLGWVGTH